MTKKLSAAQRRYIENALLIAALGLTFKKLAKDYETKSLGDIAETTSGGTPLRNISTYYGGNIPWIKSGELNDNIIENAEEHLTEEGLANSSAKIYPKGTLVVALYGATVGKTGILGLDAASNQAVCAIFPKTQQITNEYMFWFLRHKRPEFLGNSFGGAQPNISQKIIRETLIPMPSLDLQKKLSEFLTVVEKRQNGDTSKKYPILPDEFSNVTRKVTLIESLAARVHEAQRLREEAEIEADTLVSAGTRQVFKKHSWKMISIEELVGRENLKNGKSLKSDEQASDVSCLRISALRNGKIDCRDTKPISITIEEAQPYTIQKNDVYIVRGNGSKELVGRAGLVEEYKGVIIFPDLFIKVPLNSNQILPAFFVAWWNSPTLREKIVDLAKTTSGIWKINQGHIASCEIPVPPLDEQRRIVAYLDGLQAKVNALRELQVKSGEELSALIPSILDKVFKGEF